jgi:hypothetical protein
LSGFRRGSRKFALHARPAQLGKDFKLKNFGQRFGFDLAEHLLGTEHFGSGVRLLGVRHQAAELEQLVTRVQRLVVTMIVTGSGRASIDPRAVFPPVAFNKNRAAGTASVSSVHPALMPANKLSQIVGMGGGIVNSSWAARGGSPISCRSLREAGSASIACVGRVPSLAFNENMRVALAFGLISPPGR